MKQYTSEYTLNSWFLGWLPVMSIGMQTLLILLGIFILLFLLYIFIQKRKKSKILLKTLQDDMDLLVRKKTGELQEFNFALNEEIKERQRREEELKQSEEKFRILADNIPGVVYLCNNDANYSYVYLNNEIKDITEYSFKEFLSEKVSIKELCHPEDTEAVFQKMDSLNEDCTSFHHIYRVQHAKGDWRWVEEFAVGIYENKKLKYIEGYFRDITEKKVAEDQIKENLMKYRTLFNMSPTGIMIEDENGIILDVNQTTCDQMGYRKEELIGKHVKMLAPAANEQFVLNNIKQIISGMKMDHVVESITQKGEIRHLSLSECRIPLGEGKYGIIVASVDMTDRKRMEDALERARILLQSSLEQIPAGVMVADSENGQIVLANNEASSILGQSIENFYRISVEDLSGVNWKHYDALGKEVAPVNWPLSRALIKGETTPGLETLVRCEDGTEKWILSNAAPVKNYEDKIIAAIEVFSDITRIKHMENEREKLIGDLKNALEEVKTLSGMLPICSSCKKIRDDKGYWKQIESYISDHSEAKFSHGICPDCAEKLYPGYLDRIKKKSK